MSSVYEKIVELIMDRFTCVTVDDDGLCTAWTCPPGMVTLMEDAGRGYWDTTEAWDDEPIIRLGDREDVFPDDECPWNEFKRILGAETLQGDNRNG